MRVSIDDFGAGYSNLSYLRDLPASTLKIDRSFVRSLAANPRDQIIVRSVIALAHALEYRVVAEGIEDAEALAAGIIALEREIAREVLNLAAPGHSSTETLIAALRHLAGEIVAPDDIAATALREAADRLEALSKG